MLIFFCLFEWKIFVEHQEFFYSKEHSYIEALARFYMVEWILPFGLRRKWHLEWQGRKTDADDDAEHATDCLAFKICG